MSGELMLPPWTAWASLSLFVHVTVSPTPMVMSAGWNEKSRMVTEDVAASERVAAHSPKARTKSVTTSSHRRSAGTAWMRAVMGSGSSFCSLRSRRGRLRQEDGGQGEDDPQEGELDADEGDEGRGGNGVRPPSSAVDVDPHPPPGLGGDEE